MTEELITAAITAAVSRALPPLVMTLEDVANVLGYAVNYVRNELQHQPDFPQRLPRFKQPRWDRDEILGWAKAQSS